MRLFQAELLKLLTIRTPKVLLAVAGVIAVVVGVIQVIVIEYPDGSPSLSAGQVAGMLAGASAAIPLALIIGAVGSTGELRHRTEFLNHLITPRRWPQLLARIGAYLIFGLAFAAVLFTTILALIAGWALIRVGEMPWGPDSTRILLGVAMVTAAYTAVGLAVGTIVRNQVVAVTLIVAWAFILEGLVSLPLLLIDPRLSSVLPVQAAQALLIGDSFGDDFAISFGLWPTVGIIAAWTVGLSGIGIWRTLAADTR